MDRKTPKEYEKLNAKLDRMEKELIGFEEMSGLMEKAVDGKVHEIKTATYLTLVIVGIILALMLGVLLKTFFG